MEIKEKWTPKGRGKLLQFYARRRQDIGLYNTLLLLYIAWQSPPTSLELTVGFVIIALWSLFDWFYLMRQQTGVASHYNPAWHDMVDRLIDIQKRLPK